MKGASMAAGENRRNRTKEAFCHVANISAIKTSKIWCTLCPQVKNFVIFFLNSS